MSHRSAAHVALAALAALLLVLAGPAAAEPGPSSLQMSLAYDGRLFIKVLDLNFDEKIGPSGYGSSVSMASYGVLALFKHFDIKASAEGRFVGGQAKPQTFDYINHDGKRVRQVAVSWSEDDVSMTSQPAFANLGDPPATPAQKTAAADPLTQMVRIMLTPPHAHPCDGDTRYFDGKQLYSLDLVPAGTGELSDHARELGLVNPLRCTVRYRQVAGFKHKAPAKRDQGLGPISVTLGQFGQNGPWAIALMDADTKLGHARIELREAHVAGARP
jgi:hypothetical protein